MKIMLRVAIACSTAVLLAACAKSEQAAKDSAAAAAATPAPAAAPAPAPAAAISLADVAGKWQMRSVAEPVSDTTETTYVLTARAETAVWVLTFPSGVKGPVHITVSGDSLIQKTGTFGSKRR